MDIDPPTPAHARVRRLGTFVGPMPQGKYFNDISFQFQQLLNRLHSITQRLLLCAFWAVLTFADVEKLAKLILENETTTFLLDFCMHACTAIPLLWARKPPTPSQAAPPPAQQLAARKSLISPSNETTVVAFSGKLKL
ncbi:hypothetical protein RU639_002078 [Aspergillus parasiticus]